MTVNEDPGRVVSDWLHEFGAHRVPDHLDAVLRTTSTRRQRPAWSSLERWLPMDLASRASTLAQPRLGRALLIALLILALVGVSILAIGARQQRVPPPFGPARNGEIVSSADGDIYLVDPATHGSSPLIAGPTFDFGPVFSRDGTRFSFLRGGPTDCGQPDCGLILVVANADGTGVRELTRGVPMLDGLDWSPDGSQLAILSAAEDGQGHSLAIVNSDGSGMRTLDLARPVHLPSWLPPDGGEIVFRGEQLSDDAPPPGSSPSAPTVPGCARSRRDPRSTPTTTRTSAYRRTAPASAIGATTVRAACSGPMCWTCEPEQTACSRPRMVPASSDRSSHQTASRWCICGGLRATACSSSWRRPTEAPPARRSDLRRPWVPTDPRSTTTCLRPTARP